MHPFIHPLTGAVDPVWEAKSDWEIYKAIAKKFSEVAPEVLGVENDLVRSRPISSSGRGAWPSRSTSPCWRRAPSLPASNWRLRTASNCFDARHRSHLGP